MATTMPVAVKQIALEIDGRAVEVPEGTTIWNAAKGLGIEIPALCHDERYDPVGVCRTCCVDIGGRVLAASCVRPVEAGMKVRTATEQVERTRRMLVSLLESDQPLPADDPKETTTGDNELLAMARQFSVNRETTGLPTGGEDRPQDLSNFAISIDHQSCILCDRCVRACDDIQGNDVIGRTGKGYSTRIAFDLDQPMGESSCVTCGECVAACPTGAMTNKPISIPLRPREELKSVDSVCPYCGVGCAITYHVDTEQNKIVYVDGRDQPGSKGRLCVKGRYGWDYSMHTQRLTTPLIRIESSYPKGPLTADVRGDSDGRRKKPGGLVDYDEVLPHFREATWEEALDLVARRLRETKDEFGSESLAGFGSAKCSNEEAYMFQKLFRAGFGTNNVDHCTRLCHASSVAALLDGVGSGAVSTTYGDIVNSDVALFSGSNTTANHPVAASFFKQAKRRGTKLIVVDPRLERISEYADIVCQIKPGSDVAFYNGVMHEIIRLGLVDQEFVRARTTGYAELAKIVKEYPPERASQICGVDADTIREVARVWGEAAAGIIFWGMGVSQHTTGTDNARGLIALSCLTGNVGRPGTGLHPLRGQNNVQGASDVGLIPMMYPDYQLVTTPEVREKFEAAWGLELNPQTGLTVTEIISGILNKSVRAMYMMGENPFLSDPNVNKVRKALSTLDFLVVQDIFLTETSEFADVILPATSYMEKDGTYTNTDRRVQRGAKLITSPGEAREDWRIVQEISNRIGFPMNYEHPSEVFAEIVSVTPSYANLTWENIQGTGKLYPNLDPETSDGIVVLFDESFDTPDGKAHLVGAEFMDADELPDDEYTMVLTTGRLLEHWHTGSMTRRSFTLNSISPEALVYMNQDDADQLGVAGGDYVHVSSRRGAVEIKVSISNRETPGACFIPFHFREAAANLLTNDAIDPIGKIPEFKFCAVKIEPSRIGAGVVR